MKKQKKGITLIALIITIIVMLILVAVTVTLALNGGIFNKAHNASAETQKATDKEVLLLAVTGTVDKNGNLHIDSGNMNTQLTQLGGIWEVINNNNNEDTLICTNKENNKSYLVNKITGKITNYDETPITTVLPEVGAQVNYNPSGSYDWYKSLADSESAAEKIDVLNSSIEGNFRLTEWKVLEVEGNTVKIIPSLPTTGTVRLQAYQGYNNAVKLINDACGALYDGDGAGVKITARSVNMEDLEKYMDSTAVEAAKEVSGYNVQKGPYNEGNSHYPTIYSNELTGTLGMSSQNDFITTDGKVDGSNLTPKNTYYTMDNNTFSAALGNRNELFLPRGTSTPDYWVASRCVEIDDTYCFFYVRSINSGKLFYTHVFNSRGGWNNESYSLFPVVTVNSDILSGDNSNGWTVNF